METIQNLEKETVIGLQSLCKLCHDSSEGYRTAAESIDHAQMREAFLSVADKRRVARDELAGMLGTSHESIPEGGTALGKVHRWWLDIRGSLNGGNEEVVLIEAIRGERTIEDEYEDVLKKTMGSPANATLHAQLEGVKSSRKTLESLKELSD